MTHYAGEKVLELMSAYAGNRNAAVARMICRAAGDVNAEIDVLEFGSGKGEFLNRIAKETRWNLEAIEVDPRFRSELSEHFVVYESTGETKRVYDFIYLIDVLEHIKDDEECLKRLSAILKPGGKMFIYVPAFNHLYSDFDMSIGHFRRYSKRSLRKKLVAAGFHIHNLYYHDLIGYLLMRIQKFAFGHTHPAPWSARVYDRIFFPPGNFLERIFPVPFGKSLAVVVSRE
jgi:SAM-dependent methyltransferase